MDVFYINLEHAVERKHNFISSFSRGGFPSDWRLNRFEAILSTSEEVQKTEGNCAPALKGNYLSHVGCIRCGMEVEGHILIAEDDTEFAPQTHSWLSTIISQLPKNSWDVLLTDIFVASAVDMPRLLKTRRRCLEKNTVALFDPDSLGIPFAGAGCYIVNQNSKQKVLNCFSSGRIDYPFDLLLREVMRHKMLNGLIVFPFLTTVGNCADESQVHGRERMTENVLWNKFRRLVWIGNSGSFDHQGKMEVVDGVDVDVKGLLEILGPLLTMQMSWGEDPVFFVQNHSPGI